jgi:RNA polymerase-binding transcription factor DksA
MVKELVEHSKSSDIADQASETAEVFANASIEEARRRLLPQVYHGFDGKHCVECHAVIPDARLAMQRVRCTPCESELEQARK